MKNTIQDLERELKRLTTIIDDPATSMDTMISAANAALQVARTLAGIATDESKRADEAERRAKIAEVEAVEQGGAPAWPQRRRPFIAPRPYLPDPYTWEPGNNPNDGRSRYRCSTGR